jgi:hypothetical protein
MEPTIAFAFGHERLPAPLNDTSGVFLAGTNVSDDLFMYMTRLVSGLVPNTRYRVDLDVTFASDVPPGCFGIGGAPGESVYIKAGGTGVQPANIQRPGSPAAFVTTNFDHAGQHMSGANDRVIGDFAHGGGGCGDDPRNPGIWKRATLSTNGQGVVVSTDANGRLWLIVGTDSGYEGRTKIYYLAVSATLTPV